MTSTDAAGAAAIDPWLREQLLREQSAREDRRDAAFRTDIVDEAVANLEAQGLDVVGDGYAATEVTLLEGGEQPTRSSW